MLELHEVAKSYNGTPAVHPTSFSVVPGRTTVLIGPSGCGKSTLLRIMVGLVAPDSGTVKVGGDLLTPQNVLRLRTKIGYVIQDGGLFPHLTARQNVSLMAEHLRWDRERIRR